MSKLIEKVCSNVLTSIRKNAIILQTNKQTNKQRYFIPCEGRCGYLVLTALQKRKGAMA